MTIEEYKETHKNPRTDHFAVFLAKNGKKYLADSDGNIIGPVGPMRLRLYIAAQKELWNYRGTEDGYPIGFVKYGIIHSGLATLVEEQFEANPVFSSIID